MENLLLDTLPEIVKIDGREYFVDTCFRAMIVFEQVINDISLSGEQKVRESLEIFYTDKIPRNTLAAFEQLILFYSCGKKPEKKQPKKNGEVTIKERRIYDFVQDAPYIYSAFLSQYGIDLNEIEYLHWWKFDALFRGLNDDQKIIKIMGYRSADLSEIKNSKERSRMAKLKHMFSLEQNLTVEDKIAMAGSAFAGGFK